MQFTVRAIEHYSDKEGRVLLRGERSSTVTLYVPIDELSGYKLGDEYVLEHRKQDVGDSWETYQHVKEGHNATRG